MAAQFFYSAESHKEYPTHHKLFDTLCNFTTAAPEPGVRRVPRFASGFGLGPRRQRAQSNLGASARELESWLGREEEEVAFYPFLIVLEASEGSSARCPNGM